MKNSTQQYDSSYAGAQKLILDKEAKKKNSTSIIRNIIKLVFYLFVFIFLLWVYYKWQRIPVRRHYFKAEYITSADSSSRIRAKITIVDPKVLDIDSIYFDDSIRSSKSTPLDYKDYHEYFRVSSSHVKQKSAPLHPNASDDLVEYLGLPLYEVLSDSCKLHDTYIERFTDVFYYEHLDNEKLYYKKYKRDTLNIYKKRISMTEKNMFFSADSNNVSSLSLYHFNLANPLISDNIKKHSLTGYNNITQSIVLIPPYNKVYHLESFYSIKVPSKLRRFVGSLFRLEDISQSYYNITLSSNSISELLLKMDFVGTIDCNYTMFSNFDHHDGLTRSDINIGRNFIQFFTNVRRSSKTLLVLVKFNDMQNMQTSRLFILGVLITLTLTKLLGILWRILSHPLMKLWLIIKNLISKLFHKKEVVPEKCDQNEDDEVPGFYL